MLFFCKTVPLNCWLFQMVLSCCFSLAGNLDFQDFVQKVLKLPAADVQKKQVRDIEMTENV